MVRQAKRYTEVNSIVIVHSLCGGTDTTPAHASNVNVLSACLKERTFEL